MECSQVDGLWPGYLDGALEASACKDLESHLSECPACRERWRGLDYLRGAMTRLPLETPPPGMRERFAARLASETPAGRETSEPEIPEWTPPPRRGWWAERPSLAAALVFVALVAAFGLGVWTGGRSTGRLDALEEEVGQLHQLVAVSMLGQRSSFDRLRGVTYSSGLGHPTPELVSALLETLRYDSSPNVRLRVVDVLAQFDDDESVRTGLVEALGYPQSPTVQIALIDLLVDFRETESVTVLQRLAEDETVREEVRERARWGLGQLS